MADSTQKYRDLIYDVGLHQGEDTCFYLKKGFRVIAFEADPELVLLNEDRFKNEIKSGNLVIVAGAIVDDIEAEEITFYKNLDKSVWGTIDPKWAERNENLGMKSRAITVNAIDFSECLMKYGVPYYMKVDIEGADFACIKALGRFNSRPSYISIESDKVSIDNIINEMNSLRELGYDSFKAVQQQNINRLTLPKPAREGVYIDHSFAIGSSGPFGEETPGAWRTYLEIIEEYRKIIRQYRMFGDNTFWAKNSMAQRVLYNYSKIIGKPIPGWYDTHAKHNSAEH